MTVSVQDVLNLLNATNSSIAHTPQAWMRQVAPNGKGGTTQRLIGSNGKTINAKPAAQKQTQTQKGTQVLQSKFAKNTETSPVEGLIKGANGFLGGIIGKTGADAITDQASDSGPGAWFINQAAAPVNPNKTASNPVQYGLNLLSTPLYAAAEGGKQIGKVIGDETNPAFRAKEDAKPVLQRLGDEATTALSPLGGVARGVAEGFGARFDNKNPDTWGQNLEDLGTKKALEQGLGKQHGDFAQGILGGAADIAGDPLTWLSGGGTGVFRGLADSARAAGEAGDAAGAVKNFLKTLPGNVVHGVSDRAAEQFAEKAAAKANKPMIGLQKQAIKSLNGDELAHFQSLKGDSAEVAQARSDILYPIMQKLSPKKFAAGNEKIQAAGKLGPIATATDAEPAMSGFSKVSEARAAEEPIVDNMTDAPTTEANHAVADSAVQDLTEPGHAGVVPPVFTDPRYHTTQKLLPDITGTTKAAPAATILKESTVAGDYAPMIEGPHAEQLLSLVKTANTPAKFAAAIAEAKTNPQIRDFLSTSATVGSRKINVEELAKKVATGDSLATAYPRYEAALQEAMAQGVGTASRVDPAKLGDALTQRGAGVVDPDSVVDALNSTGVEGRKTILQNLLGGAQTKKYDSFDAAMAGAVKGEVDPSTMRTMLHALGIDTKAAQPTSLRRLMNGQGKTNWAQIQGSVRTPEEVLTIHGIDPVTAADAAAVDLDRVENGAAAVADDEMRKAVGYDATKIGPIDATKDSIGNAIYNGERELGSWWARAGGSTVEAYDNNGLQAVSRGILKSLAHYANLTFKSGKERADYLFTRYHQAMQLIEAHQLGLGNMPRIVDREDTDALHVSFSQIMTEMDEAAIRRAMFEPLRDRPTHMSEAGVDFRPGFTIYPNHIANAVRHATRGNDTEAVEAQLTQDVLKTSPGIAHTMPDFEGAIHDVAVAATDPAFVARMKELDAQQGPIAVAFSERLASESTQPVMQKVYAEINKAGDRGTLLKRINEAIDAAKDHAHSAAGYPSLASDEVTQRMDASLISGILGDNGALMVASMNRKSAASAIARSSKTVFKKTKAQSSREVQHALNKAAVDDLSDADDIMRDSYAPAIAQDVEEQDREAEALDVTDLMSLRMEYNGIYRAFAKFGTAVDGHAFVQGLKDLHTNETYTGQAVHVAYTQLLGRWKNGGRYSLTSKPTPGINQRLADIVGSAQPLDDAAVNAKIDQWWEALAATTPHATDEEIMAELLAGKPRSPRNGVPNAIPPLQGSELQMAMELHGIKNEIFDESGQGLFTRSGLKTQDLINELKSYSDFTKGGRHESALPTSNEDSAAFAADSWRKMNDIPDKLELLNNYMHGFTNAMVAPAVMATYSKDIAIHAPTPQMIKDLNLIKFNNKTQNPRDLARFLGDDDWAPRSEAMRLTYLQDMINYNKTIPGPFGQVVHFTDAVTNLVKLNLTSLRPAHWVTNLLGDGGFNVLAGMNPLAYIRGIKTMQALGAIQKLDNGWESELLRLIPETGQAIKPKHASDFVYVNVNGKIQPVSLGEVGIVARRKAVMLQHSNTDDLLGGDPTHVNRTQLQKLRAPFTKANNGLGHAAAQRDNLNRIPLFIDRLEKGNFKSLDAAYDHAAAEVHSWHPTTLSLSNVERKYVRRLFLFYTWTRLASEKVIKAGLDRPGALTAPSKIQYEMAQANGLNPDSIGDPINLDSDIPTYNATTLLGPTFFGGLGPFDAGTNQWGVSLSVPQLDTLDSLSEGSYTSPGDSQLQSGINSISGTGQDIVANNLTPFLSLPLSMMAGNNLSRDPVDITNDNKLMLDSFGGGLTSILKGTGAYDKMFPSSYQPTTPAEIAEQKAEQAGNNQRAWLNYLTGLKYTNYDSPTAAAVAAKEKEQALAKATGSTIGTYGQITGPNGKPLK